MPLSIFVSNLLCSLFAVSCLAVPPVTAIQPIIVNDSVAVKGIKITQPAEYNETDSLASAEGIISKTDQEGIVDFEEASEVVTISAPVAPEIINYIQSFASAPAVYAPKDFAPLDPVGNLYAKWLETAWINTVVSADSDNSTTTTIEAVVVNNVSTTSSIELNSSEIVATSTATSTLHLVINALSIGTASSTVDEFIEIYNSTSAVVNLADWKLQRVTASGKTENYLVRPFPEGAIINSFGYYLIAHPTGYSTTTPDRVLPDTVYTTLSSIASSNTIILLDSDGLVIDLVGYGEATQFESAPAPELENDGQVLSRTEAIDTDHNDVDFKLISR